MAKDREDLGNLREVLSKLQTEPEWELLWEHLMAARQDCLVRLVAVENCDQCLVVRGGFNALCRFLEFGDDLLDRLEEAMRRQGEQDGGVRGQGAGGYTNGRDRGQGG